MILARSVVGAASHTLKRDPRPSYVALSQYFRHLSTPANPPPSVHKSEDRIRHIAHFPESLRKLALSLPTASARPTKDELLSRSSSFWERLRIRFKWLTIRGFRRFRADDWSAFVSWILGGVGIWIVVGTTSFFSVVFILLNSLQLQQHMATSLGNYLTAHTGITVVFESAIVPKFSWRDSRIVFKNVYVSRGSSKRNSREGAHKGPVRELQLDKSTIIIGDDELPVEAQTSQDHSDSDNKNWTSFHLSIDTVDVSLSLPQWLDGKGLVKDAVVKGVRGVIDRSHIKYDPEEPLDRLKYRNQPKPGDFHLSHLSIEDFLVTMYQPNDFRPFTFSIFHANIPTLRKQWLFFDLMSADSITGQIDNCLFSLHKPQSIGRTSEEDLRDGTWKRMSRFRIDGVPIDHLQTPSDTGALSWITSGKLDFVADVRFPRDPSEEVDLQAILGDIADRFDEVIHQPVPSDRIPGRSGLAMGQALEAPQRESTRQMLGLPETKEEDVKTEVSIDLDIRFKDVKAAVPIFTSDLSYVNNALIRPIVAFINANRTLIPIKCHLDLDLKADFDGSWTTYDVGILDAISEQVYAAFAHHVQTSNAKRAKQVVGWSLQVTAQAVMDALSKMESL